MASIPELVDELCGFWGDDPFDSKAISSADGQRFVRIISEERDAAARIAQVLKGTPSPEQLTRMSGAAAAWEYFIALFELIGRHHESALLAHALYRDMFDAEQKSRSRIHKGMPLVRIADAYRSLGYVAHEERYLMLTLCEDAIRASYPEITSEGPLQETRRTLPSGVAPVLTCGSK